MKKKNALKRIAAGSLAAILMLAVLSCGGTGETETAADTTAGTETDPATAPETVEEETTMEEETKTPEPEPADGLFDSVVCLKGFLESQNGSYMTTEQCDLIWNEDGTLTMKGTWAEGKEFSPALTVSYAKMVKSCCSDYTDTDSLPNAAGLAGDPYRALVFTVRSDKSIAGDTNLYITSGKRNAGEGIALPLVDSVGSGDREYLVYDISGQDFTVDYINKIKFTWAWGIGSADNLGASVTVEAIEFFHTFDEVWAAKGTAPQQPVDLSGEKLGMSADMLDDLVQDVFSGGLVRNETVMFIDPGDEKALLYKIDEVLSVTNYDNTKTYVEGKDYAVRDGKLVALEGGRLPLITAARYYNVGSDSILMTEYQGKSVYTHWGEGRAMTDWQVNVTYTHSDTWDGFRTPCRQSVYTQFLDKLKNGEDVTIIFYGDSCTYGAASSFAYGYAPHQKSYAMLFTETLAKLYDGSVHYITLSKPDTCYVPREDVVYGSGSRITFINPSVGGWTSADGVTNFSSYLAPYIRQYGCDLFVLDLGGNDGSAPAENTRRNDEKIMDSVLELAPDTSAIIMTTLLNNVEATNGWAGGEYMQEPLLVKCAEQYRRRGVPCACCQFNGTHRALLQKINYRDVSGNNVNHPNDFLCRVYAGTLIQTVLGYENFD